MQDLRGPSGMMLIPARGAHMYPWQKRAALHAARWGGTGSKRMVSAQRAHGA